MKKSLLSLMVISVMMLGLSMNTANAEEQQAKQPPKHNFGQPQGPKFHKGHHPSREELAAKKVEFEKRLNLTEEQKKQIEVNRQKDHEKAKPIIDELRAKHGQYMDIVNDKTLSDKDKTQKKNELKKEIKELKVKADNLRKENMKDFEAILTPEQKAEFAKIKEEQKQKMEQRKKDFEKMKKNHEKMKKENEKMGLPFNPKPTPHPIPVPIEK